MRLNKMTAIAAMLLLASEAAAINIRYKSDDMDDLLEGVIMNKH